MTQEQIRQMGDALVGTYGVAVFADGEVAEVS